MKPKETIHTTATLSGHVTSALLAGFGIACLVSIASCVVLMNRRSEASTPPVSSRGDVVVTASSPKVSEFGIDAIFTLQPGESTGWMTRREDSKTLGWDDTLRDVSSRAVRYRVRCKDGSVTGWMFGYQRSPCDPSAKSSRLENVESMEIRNFGTQAVGLSVKGVLQSSGQGQVTQSQEDEIEASEIQAAEREAEEKREAGSPDPEKPRRKREKIKIGL